MYGQRETTHIIIILHVSNKSIFESELSTPVTTKTMTEIFTLQKKSKNKMAKMYKKKQ